MGGKTLGTAARVGADVMTFGTNELVGNPAGKLANKVLGFGSSPSSAVGPGGPGTQADPKSILEQSGGAVLLSNIAAGADPDTALSAYLGVAPGNLPAYLAGLDEADKNAISGIQTQLHQITSNTDYHNQTVQKLINDYPNLMANSIQKYGAMADDTIKPVLDQAMKDITAKQVANGGFSSGATAEAAALAGTKYGYDKLNYATGMAGQDFNNQLTEAEALRGFQQKMLGQGATQGFNTQQNALQRNAGIANTNAELAVGQANRSQNQQATLYGGLGKVGGGLLGGLIGGPTGVGIGGSIGETVGTAAGQGQLF